MIDLATGVSAPMKQAGYAGTQDAAPHASDAKEAAPAPARKTAARSATDPSDAAGSAPATPPLPATLALVLPQLAIAADPNPGALAEAKADASGPASGTTPVPPASAGASQVQQAYAQGQESGATTAAGSPLEAFGLPELPGMDASAVPADQPAGGPKSAAANPAKPASLRQHTEKATQVAAIHAGAPPAGEPAASARTVPAPDLRPDPAAASTAPGLFPTALQAAPAPLAQADPAAAPPAAGTPAADAVPPATQLSHAVAALHVNSDGSSQLTIRLDPAELGHVRVEIVRGQDGASSVRVAVERVDTLVRLQADLTHLHLALDRAGVPEQRSLVLHLASQEQAGTPFGGQPGASSGGQGGQSGGFQSSRHQAAGGGAASNTADADGQAAQVSPTNTRRIDAGVDITA